MAKRKYDYFILVTEDGNETYTSYREVFSAYQGTKDSATLYGVSVMGELEVVFSK